ncbi:MAG: hypothetical protein MJ000_06205 [Bacteroidales bacterium]|nr:hypothetical protein [Bacteroidales bacterium]
MDFTLKKYKLLIEALVTNGYHFQTFKDFLENQHEGKTIILRHDVDLKPGNSLSTAVTEHELGIEASYYFRAVPESWDEDIIKKTAALGHEIGYHYESLTTANGDIDKAYADFVGNLSKLNSLLNPSNHCQTICMHGSPRSPYDSKDIWKKYSYKELNIIGEPYFDMDFSKTFYLTDTGRRWDGYNVSVRDKIPVYQDEWTRKGLVFHKTDDIIKAANAGDLPDVVMITTHPQRWTDDGLLWMKEFFFQNIKNVVKFFYC